MSQNMNNGKDDALMMFDMEGMLGLLDNVNEDTVVEDSKKSELFAAKGRMYLEKAKVSDWKDPTTFVFKARHIDTVVRIEGRDKSYQTGRIKMMEVVEKNINGVKSQVPVMAGQRYMEIMAFLNAFSARDGEDKESFNKRKLGLMSMAMLQQEDWVNGKKEMMPCPNMVGLMKGLEEHGVGVIVASSLKWGSKLINAETQQVIERPSNGKDAEGKFIPLSAEQLEGWKALQKQDKTVFVDDYDKTRMSFYIAMVYDLESGKSLSEFKGNKEAVEVAKKMTDLKARTKAGVLGEQLKGKAWDEYVIAEHKKVLTKSNWTSEQIKSVKYLSIGERKNNAATEQAASAEAAGDKVNDMFANMG